jgi:DNA-directed RNA polymerase specialized sigma24 family protein
LLITSTAIIKKRHFAGIENLMKYLDVLIRWAPGFGRHLTAPDTVADGEENDDEDNEEDEEEQEEAEETEEEEEESEEDEEEEDDFIQSLNGKKKTCPIY